jgi:uncharacterized protein YciI
MASLFIIDLHYVADLAEVDHHTGGHMGFIKRNYDAGHFLLSGRKEPRTGGVILARGNRADIEALIDSDPFRQHGLAEYTITEFLPTTTVPELALLKHVS